MYDWEWSHSAKFGQNLKVFLEFAEMVDPFTSSYTRRIVCKGLVLRQLHSVESLASVVLEESNLWFSSPAERALAAKMLHRSLVATTASRVSEIEIAAINPAVLGSRALGNRLELWLPT